MIDNGHQVFYAKYCTYFEKVTYHFIVVDIFFR